MNLAPHRFTLRQLQYVVAVGDAKSFRRAAELCHVSQPSLSAQVAEIEEALGVQLFDRDRRRVLLTQAGEELVEHARRLLLQADAFVDACQRFVDPFAGTLRLGVIPTVAPYALPWLVPGLRAAFPSLIPLWVEEQTARLNRMLQRGELDAALLARETTLQDLELAPVGRDPFVVALPHHHRLAATEGPLPEGALQDETVLLLDEEHCLRDQAIEACAMNGVHEHGFRATSLSTLVQMVASGVGVTLLPRVAAEIECRHAGIVVRALASPTSARTLVLAWRRGSPIADALRRLAGELARLHAARFADESAACDVEVALPV